ncbi:transcriptional regulator CynR [soil metagenome]
MVSSMHHELEKFMAIVEHGSFTAAAKHVRISQPALTSALQSLEKRYGSKLIIRNSRPLQLTKSGQAVYATAVRIKLDLSRLSNELADINSGNTARIAVGAIDSVAMRLFKHDVNTDNLEVHVDNSTRLIETLSLAKIELVFIAEPLIKPAGNIIIKPLCREKFALVTTPGLAEATRQDLVVNRLIDSFVTYNPESTTFKRITAHLEAVNIQAKVTFVSTSPEIMRQVVLNGGGSALLPYSLVENELKTGKLSVVEKLKFERPIAYAYLPDRQFREVHLHLIEALQGKEL